ncbi:MAG: hypothetical protein O2816_15410 [Planctomycetota bacterium]|nr:hypothetical protein [Planctomycetota bacterium]
MRPLRYALPLVLTVPALAQSFNIDVGPNLILAPEPPPTYGAAADQFGQWMPFEDPFGLQTLVDLSGGQPGATLESDNGSWVNVWPSVITSSGDQELMEDFQWLPNLDVPVTWSFAGLQPGEYELFTYASDPSGGQMTRIEVLGSVDPAKVVGGPWPGGHFEGNTYCRHLVTVTDGSFTVIAMGDGPQPNNSGALNGFQLVKLDGGGGPVGGNYCTPANLNSTGSAAAIFGFGSDVAGDNFLTLTADQLPANQFAYFLASQTQDFVAFPGGSQGNLCLGGTVGRFVTQIQNSGPGGEVTISVNLSAIPVNPPAQVMPGETWSFQCWFRDVNPTPTSNFTDGLEILFQ